MPTVFKNKFIKVYIVILCVCFLVPFAVSASTIDSDGDKLSDVLEQKYYTDPNNPDTDGDGYSDYIEIYHGYSPWDKEPKRLSQMDSDGDGLSDGIEAKLQTDIRSSDSDGDGYSDYEELMSGYSPFSSDSKAMFGRKIVVDKTVQQLFIEVDGGVRIAQFPVSTGNPWTPTPNGSFDILKKQDVKRYVGIDYDLPNTKWNMLFKSGGYYLHGAYWHNNFGISTNSHGCINMRTEDAEVIYKYFGVGDTLEVVGITPSKRKVGT